MAHVITGVQTIALMIALMAVQANALDAKAIAREIAQGIVIIHAREVVRNHAKVVVKTRVQEVQKSNKLIV